MNKPLFARGQRGATLVVGLIMLLLFTLLVSGAFTLSTVNLQAVSNMQAREEALAAANSAIEVALSNNFTSAPAATSSNVDINNDGSADYLVSIAKPECIRATIAQATAASSVKLGQISSGTWNTVWSLDATVTDDATGAEVHVRSGVRVLLSDAQKGVVCDD